MRRGQGGGHHLYDLLQIDTRRQIGDDVTLAAGALASFSAARARHGQSMPGCTQHPVGGGLT